ncbi:MAG TPA: BrnT family toxin [Rhodospirillales bacterium]|nr:BrnT family toxin [Rhodospirillales bacterium]
MNVEFDAEKDEANRRKHGLSLALAAAMDFDETVVIPDERRDYGEARFRAFGPIHGRLHVLAFTMRGGTLRAVSLRKANPRERRLYERRHRQPGMDG